MATQTFTVTVPSSHKITVPANIPTGSKLKFFKVDKASKIKKPGKSSKGVPKKSLFGILKHLGPVNVDPNESGVDEEAIADMEAEWDEFYGPSRS